MKVVATAPGFEEAAALLKQVADVDVVWSDAGRIFTEDELAEMLPKYDAAVVWIDPLKGKAMDAAKSILKAIGVPRAGYDNVDVQAATKAGIPVVYSPGMNSTAVADFTIGLILSLSRGIASANLQLKTGGWKGRWAMHLGFNLEGKVLGVIGLGSIGCRVALRAIGFGMKLLAYDPYLSYDTPTALGLFPRELGVKLVDLQTLLKASDIITIHVPITSETSGLIGWKELEAMKNTAYIVNTSRGGIVDEKALYEALKECRIAGAALDVFEKEPVDPSNPLLKLDNVVATPHIAWCTYESMRRSNMAVAGELLKILKGEKPSLRFLANPEVLRKI